MLPSYWRNMGHHCRTWSRNRLDTLAFEWRDAVFPFQPHGLLIFVRGPRVFDSPTYPTTRRPPNWWNGFYWVAPPDIPGIFTNSWRQQIGYTRTFPSTILHHDGDYDGPRALLYPLVSSKPLISLSPGYRPDMAGWMDLVSCPSQL